MPYEEEKIWIYFSISYIYKYCNVYAVNNLRVINKVEVSSLH